MNDCDIFQCKNNNSILFEYLLDGENIIKPFIVISKQKYIKYRIDPASDQSVFPYENTY